MRRLHHSPLLAIAAFCLAWFVQSAAAEPEKLGSPKENVAQTPKKEAEPAPKDTKEEPKAEAKKEEAPKEAAKEEAKKDEPKKDEPKAHEVPVLQAKKAARDGIKSAIDELKNSSDAAAFGNAGLTDAKGRGDTAWVLTASAFVMLMLPGLALFYGGMVRKKNVLATMMQSYAALAVVGVYWIAVGYGLAFGPSKISITMWGTTGGVIGWSPDLFFLRGFNADAMLPAYNISVYAHVMFQGMFAIITPALISGALAERIRFWPFCIYMILWVTLVYCPLAHMVWAFDWFTTIPVDAAKGPGGSAIGFLGKLGALDFAGGTVVHIAAGTAGLACALVLRKRVGYPEHTIQPNSMVLTLIGAGLLWFGWFGFNGGSALNATALAGSAFSATQAAAAAAGLSWITVEWIMKGKPTALGMASGIVAGLVAVTPASGFVLIWGGIAIGVLAGIVCYFTVAMKSVFGYDDSLDAFGVHAIGGFLGAVLTGIFCYASVQSASADGYFAIKGQKARLEELRKEISDYATLADIDEKSKSAEALQKDIDALSFKIEDAQADLGAIAADEKATVALKTSAAEDIKKAEADLEKAKAGKNDKEIAAADKALADAKAVPDKIDALAGLYKDLAKKTAELEETKKAADALGEKHKKSESSKRLESIDKVIAEKDAAADKAKAELADASSDFDAKALKARQASESPKKDPTAIKEYEEAKKTKEAKNDAYQSAAAEAATLKAEKKTITDKRSELVKLEAFSTKLYTDEKSELSQFMIQLKAACFSTVFAFTLSLILAIAVQAMTLGNFTTDKKSESEGLDLTEHGEIGFDLSVGYDSIPVHGTAEPKAAKLPPGMKRFDVVLEGIDNGALMKAWSELCQPSDQPIDPDFKAIYPYVTTVQGNRFRLRGGDPATLSASIQRLFTKKLGKPMKVQVEE